MVKLSDYGFEEEQLELSPGTFLGTGFPKSLTTFRLGLSRHALSLEGPYYWVLGFYKNDFGIAEFEKITDVFAGSAFSGFGSTQATKNGVVQDRASSFLATAGKMSKEIFQIIRELRIIDEKLGHYYDSWGMDPKTNERDDKKRSDAAEVVLKGYWIDLVDGGSKSPTSVYGMAANLNYGALPDLFFKVNPTKEYEIETYIHDIAGQFNDAVKKVLKRKLQAFLKWKQTTFDELLTRKNFTKKYLKQHYQVIKMYLDWAKPYLKSSEMFKNRQKFTGSVNLVSSFNSTMLEIEFLAIASGKKAGLYKPVIVLHFDFTSKPEGKYNPQYNQTELSHMGDLEITWRAYSWTDAQIWAYKKMREDEDNEMIGDVIGSMNGAMNEYDDEIKNYIEDLGESFDDTYEDKKIKLLKEQILNYGQKNNAKIEEILKEKDVNKRISDLENLYSEVSKNKKDTWAAPVVEIMKGFKEIGGALVGKDLFKEEPKKGILRECPVCKTHDSSSKSVCSKCKYVFDRTAKEKEKDKGDAKAAGGYAKAASKVCYEKFKKAHRMVTW